MAMNYKVVTYSDEELVQMFATDDIIVARRVFAQTCEALARDYHNEYSITLEKLIDADIAHDSSDTCEWDGYGIVISRHISNYGPDDDECMEDWEILGAKEGLWHNNHEVNMEFDDVNSDDFKLFCRTFCKFNPSTRILFGEGNNVTFIW